MRKESKKAVILNFDPPRKVGRTGHMSVMVIANEIMQGAITPELMLLFFSMYHNYKPSAVSRLPITKKVVTSFPSIVVDDFSDEAIMRGQSWKKLEDEPREKEDVAIDDLVKTLPIDAETRKKYFRRGLTKFNIQVPLSDIDAFTKELERIKINARWALFAPLLENNCSSAIWLALEKGGINQQKNGLIPQASAPVKILFWMSYFLLLISAAIPKPNSDSPLTTVCYAPLLYFAMQLAQSLKNAYFYASDMKMMAKDPDHIESKTLFFVYFMSFAVNTLGAMVSTNACFDLFKFPTCLARAARNIPGARDVQLEFDVEKFAAVRCE